MSRSVDPLVVGRVIGDVIDMFAPSVDMAVVYTSRKVIVWHERFLNPFLGNCEFILWWRSCDVNADQTSLRRDWDVCNSNDLTTTKEITLNPVMQTIS